MQTRYILAKAPRYHNIYYLLPFGGGGSSPWKIKCNMLLVLLVRTRTLVVICMHH